jgi:Fe-S cluster biosynthesis and repair protein YggX
MTRTINCAKLKKEAEGLALPPYPGELGQKIFNSISAEAWEQWLAHQTMLINEYRLNMLEPDARKFLKEEMEKFLFGEGSEKPQGYVPEEK